MQIAELAYSRHKLDLSSFMHPAVYGYCCLHCCKSSNKKISKYFSQVCNACSRQGYFEKMVDMHTYFKKSPYVMSLFWYVVFSSLSLAPMKTFVGLSYVHSSSICSRYAVKRALNPCGHTHTHDKKRPKSLNEVHNPMLIAKCLMFIAKCQMLYARR